MQAQKEQAWVIFKEKSNAQKRLKYPRSFLTKQALARKVRHGIKIDERDLPINQRLISVLKKQKGINYMAQSKWFNAAFVEGSSAKDVRNLERLPFVKEVFFMNRTLNTSRKYRLKTPKYGRYLEPKKFRQARKISPKPLNVYGKKSKVQLAQLQLQNMHRNGYTGEGMIIGVIDLGFRNVDNLEGFARLRKRGGILGTYDFVDKTKNIFKYKGGGHGTNVLSLMAGFVKGQHVGSAPNAKYYLFRTESDDYEQPVEEAFFTQALERADSLGVDVINASLGYDNTFDDKKYGYKPSDMDGKTSFVSLAATLALDKGMIPVIGAGNNHKHISKYSSIKEDLGDGLVFDVKIPLEFWKIILTPGDAEGILSVGGVNAKGFKEFTSSVGPTADGRRNPNVVARGTGMSILSSLSNKVVASASIFGASYATPLITGGVACLSQALPHKKPKQIIAMVKRSGHISKKPTNYLGYGLPKFFNLLPKHKTNQVSRKVITENGSQVKLIKEINSSTLTISDSYLGEKYIISDLTGKTILSGDTTNKVINIDKLVSDFYIINVNDGETILSSETFKKAN